MKSLMTCSLLACTLALAGCATPEVSGGAGGAVVMQAEMAKDNKDDSVLLTGSRIKQKGSSHSTKQTGGKDYKQSSEAGGQHNPSERQF